MPYVRGRNGLAQEWVPYRAQELAMPAPARHNMRADSMALEARQWGSGRGRGAWGEGAWSSYSWGWGWVSNGQTSTSTASATTKEPTSNPDPTTPSTTSSQPASSNEPKPSTDPSSPPAGSDPPASDQQGGQSTLVETGSRDESTGTTTAPAPSHPAAQLLPSPGDSPSSGDLPSSPALSGANPTNSAVGSSAAGGHGPSSRTIALVITSVLLLVILIALLFFLCRRRRKKADDKGFYSSDVNRDSALPRPFTQLSSISNDTAERDMTMIGGSIDKIGHTATGDIKRGTHGWPGIQVQLSDAGAAADLTYDISDRPSSITSSFISPLTSEAPSYKKQPLQNIVEDGYPVVAPTASISPVGSEPANFRHATASPDSTTRMLSSPRVSHTTHSVRFSSSSGTTLMSSSSRDPQRDRELEELHNAMQRAGLNVQTLLSSLQSRPVHEEERDARPPEYGA